MVDEPAQEWAGGRCGWMRCGRPPRRRHRDGRGDAPRRRPRRHDPLLPRRRALPVLAAGRPASRSAAGTTPVIVLEHSPELKHASPRDAGLFHTAILFDTEEALAAAVYSVAQEHPGHVHRQLRPPGEQGVLLQRPREQRRRALLGPRAQPVELGARQHRDGHDVPRPERVPAGAPHRGRASSEPAIGGARVGHVHLQVGDVESAREFYVNRLGFDADDRRSPARRSSSAPAATTTTWR